MILRRFSFGPPRQIENRLLCALLQNGDEHIWSFLEPVNLTLYEAICDTGAQPEYVYFPLSCLISFLYTTEDGSMAEMGLVGKDGIVGIECFLGGGAMPHKAVVQIAGRALRMKSRLLRAEFARGGFLTQVLLLYTQCFLTQIAQIAVCNGLHSVEKRLCRWLLWSRDLITADDFLITQQALGHHLGGRRESVTVAAGRLRDAGLIRYARGHIRIVDRQKLERASCECYHVMKNEFDRLLNRTGLLVAESGSCLSGRGQDPLSTLTRLADASAGRDFRRS